jgi:hypothetical protein
MSSPRTDRHSSTARFTFPSTHRPDRTADRLWPTGNEADRAARGSPMDFQQADRTEDKRSGWATESHRKRCRPAPRSHGTPRGSRRRRAPATSHRVPARSRHRPPALGCLRSHHGLRPPPGSHMLRSTAHHRNLMRRAHVAGPLGHRHATWRRGRSDSRGPCCRGQAGVERM